MYIYNQLYLSSQSFHSKSIANTELTGLLLQLQHSSKQATSFSMNKSDMSEEPTEADLQGADGLAGWDPLEGPLMPGEAAGSSAATKLLGSDEGKPLHA